MLMDPKEAVVFFEQTAKTMRELLEAGGVPSGSRLEYWSECSNSWCDSHVNRGDYQSNISLGLHYRLVRISPEKRLVPHTLETFREWH